MKVDVGEIVFFLDPARCDAAGDAAFVEYGGNRHGFLAFNEIHPDYYQIPHADREALMREAEEDDDDHGPGDRLDGLPGVPPPVPFARC